MWMRDKDTDSMREWESVWERRRSRTSEILRCYVAGGVEFSW